MVITVRDDLDLDKIADSGQCFRWEKTDNETYRILSGIHSLYITTLGNARYELACSEEEFASLWRDYLDLNENYAQIRARIDPEADPFLYSAAEHEKGIRILRQDAWEMLITFIISQNRNIPAIRRSVALLAERCGEQRTDSRGCLYYAFPSPSAIAQMNGESLAQCRLGYRCPYVRGAALSVLCGETDLASLRSDDEERTLHALMKLKGVGIKVASCVSLFGLHHIDAFPQDVWIRRILSLEYPNGYPFEQYSPYNGIYQQYMFAHYRHMDHGTAASRRKTPVSGKNRSS